MSIVDIAANGFWVVDQSGISGYPSLHQHNYTHKNYDYKSVARGPELCTGYNSG